MLLKCTDEHHNNLDLVGDATILIRDFTVESFKKFLAETEL